MKLISHIVPIAQLTRTQRHAMLDLMREHYMEVCALTFQRDLDEKDWVITLFDNKGILRGFSTQKLLEFDNAGTPIRVLFSGDTIVDRQHWGDRALGHAWGNLALQLLAAEPVRELYWFLISQGYRTYRFLPLFFQEFYPRFDQETPREMKSLIDRLAAQRYGHDYDADQGVVQPSTHQYRLRAELGEVSDLRLQDPHVRFFVTANPRYTAGAELCCLARITCENFTPAAWRVINSARQFTPSQDSLPCG